MGGTVNCCFDKVSLGSTSAQRQSTEVIKHRDVIVHAAGINITIAHSGPFRVQLIKYYWQISNEIPLGHER